MVRTDNGWGIASGQWFKDLATARFYERHGRFPEPAVKPPASAQGTLRCFDCGRPTICPDCDPTAAQPPAAPRKPICCYCDNDLCCAHCGREQPDDSEQPPAAPVGLDVLRQMVQRQRDIPGMPPQQTGRPSGSNADEWNCFLSEHLNSTSFLAVQIAEAIEDGEKRGSLSRSSAGRETELLATLVYEAMRFAIWAAGQGIMPDEGEPAQGPEDFLYEYSCALEIDDWEGLAEVARDHVRAVPQGARK